MTLSKLARRVASRFAMEFPTEEALKIYLKEHPEADRSKHTVSKGKSTSSASEEVLKPIQEALSEVGGDEGTRKRLVKIQTAIKSDGSLSRSEFRELTQEAAKIKGVALSLPYNGPLAKRKKLLNQVVRSLENWLKESLKP